MVRFRKKSGYTLIELIVVISIIGMLMAIAIPSFHNYERNSSVRSSAKALRSLFWDAQSISLAPKKVEVTSYSVDIRKDWGNGDTIEIKDSQGESISGINLEKNIRIENVLLDNNVQNETLIISFLTGNKEGGSMDFDPPGRVLIITIGSSLSNLKYDIILNSITNNISMRKL